MRLWSLAFLAIAVLAALASFSDDGKAVTFARALFGVTLLLFAVLVVVGRRDRDGHHDR